jgi:phenylpropionate dioxygenase-like ring-hydroxylating dioxygenase large terminal subunit
MPAPLRRYPLAIIKDLDPRRPTAARLLGIPVVMWRDGSGAWRAFEDRCPHRWDRPYSAKFGQGWPQQ